MRTLLARTLILSFLLSLLGSISAQATKAVVKRRVLLLDFQNTSKNPNYDYLKESLSDNLKVELIKSGKFTVVDQRTFEKLNPNITMERMTVEEAAKLGESINCEAVVIGKFLATPRRIRINAQGIDSLTGELVVAEKADGEITSKVFETIDRVVLPLVAGMVEKLPPLEEGKLKRKLEIEEKLVESENGRNSLSNSRPGTGDNRSLAFLYGQISVGYHFPLGTSGNFFNSGFSAKASATMQAVKYVFPYVSGGAIFYSGQSALSNGYFYFADGGFSLPFNLTSKFTLMPYAAAGILGGNLASSTSAARILVPVIDAGVYASYYFSASLGITLSASALYAMDKPDALLFSIISAGVGLRY